MRLIFILLIVALGFVAYRYRLMSAQQFQLLGFALVGVFILFVRRRYGRR